MIVSHYLFIHFIQRNTMAGIVKFNKEHSFTTMRTNEWVISKREQD